jgi:hypothetical protein
MAIGFVVNGNANTNRNVVTDNDANQKAYANTYHNAKMNASANINLTIKNASTKHGVEIEMNVEKSRNIKTKSDGKVKTHANTDGDYYILGNHLKSI